MTNTTPANTDATRVKLLAFAFPFRKKGVGKAAGKFITDEHEFHALLKKEASGNYSVSAKGMWHGGIHISEGGAGSSLDLKYGVRCIADGEVVAFRINRNYLVSQMPAQGDKPAREALFSTGFALVRHTMEFPKGTKLTFFSLYMHLKHMAGYESDKTLAKPGYWTPDFKVTQFANDKPTGRRGGAASTDQVGLRVRATHPRGTPLCILPRGAQVSIGKREGNWGQIQDTQGVQLIPPKNGGTVASTAAIGGWVFLGKEAGHLVAEEIVPDSMLDRVVTLGEKPYRVKAGDLIGHIGRYDALSQPTETRMVHIEVFCGDGIKAFIQKGRDWIDNHGHHPDDWKPLGLSSEPTLLRIDKNTKLYKQPFNEGTAPSLSDVIQIVALAQLAKNPDNKRMETAAVSGEKLPWWHVKSADVLGHDIAGWVRQENFAGGRVTREFAQSWIDFDASFEDPHDPTHTMFATTKAYVDYAMGANVPAPAAMDKLSPLMAKVYRAIYSRGNGSQAADDLCAATDDPWRALRVSRLIIKHESEWANPSKWKQLIQEIEKQTGPQPQHAEEQKRIEKLVWWDDAKAGVSDLPGSDVFHIHPIGIVGNFYGECDCMARFQKISIIVLLNEGGFVNDASDSGGATNKGIAWNTWTSYAKSDIGVEPTLENLKIITDEQAKIIYFNHYWEPRGFCGIKNEKTALNIYDWTITSGKAIRKIQEVLTSYFSKELDHNNKMSKEFVDAINSIENQEDLVEKIGAARKQYYTSLCYDASGKETKNHKFLKGWLARVDRCLDYKG